MLVAPKFLNYIYISANNVTAPTLDCAAYRDVKLSRNIADRLEGVEERLFMGGTPGNFEKKIQTRFCNYPL